MTDGSGRTITLSFIVPVYNAEGTLGACVRSVLGAGEDIEALLIDDGSSDGSRALADSLAANDGRVRVFHRQNAGVSAARNAGLSRARGEWVCFVDSDDLISPTFRGALESAMAQAPDMVLFSWREFVGEGNPFPSATDANKPERALTGDELTLLRRNTLYRADYLETSQMGFTFARGVWGCLMRRDIIEKNQLSFAEGVSMGEDAAFRLSYLKYCRSAVAVDATLYGYRAASQSITRKLNADIGDTVARTIACMREVVDERYFGDAEMRRRLYAEAIFESQWLFLLHIAHPKCGLNDQEKADALMRLLLTPDMREAVRACDRALLLPPLDGLLDAYRLTDQSAVYPAALAAMRKSDFRQRLTALLDRLGLLKKAKHLYRAVGQALRDRRK